MHLIYSQTLHPLADGRKLINPRFFTGPVEGAESVVILGEWPAIAEAYRAAGVEVSEPDLIAPTPGKVLTEAPATWVDPVKPGRGKKAAPAEAEVEPQPVEGDE